VTPPRWEACTPVVAPPTGGAGEVSRPRQAATPCTHNSPFHHDHQARHRGAPPAVPSLPRHKIGVAACYACSPAPPTQHRSTHHGAAHTINGAGPTVTHPPEPAIDVERAADRLCGPAQQTTPNAHATITTTARPRTRDGTCCCRTPSFRSALLGDGEVGWSASAPGAGTAGRSDARGGAGLACLPIRLPIFRRRIVA
jgi:hypothetical protein